MRTVVIIDDEYGVADVVAASLADLGFRAYTAANGMQGLQLVAEQHPDVILLDYMMPLLDGPGVLRALQADPELAVIPVIMMSSMPEASVRSRCGGPFTFLRKPFSLEALLQAIERALCRPSAAPERG